MIRADRLVSLHISDGEPSGRLGPGTQQGVLWAYVNGRDEPVRIDAFAGISPDEILFAMTQALAEAAGGPDERVAYVYLYSTSGRVPKPSIRVMSKAPELWG